MFEKKDVEKLINVTEFQITQTREHIAFFHDFDGNPIQKGNNFFDALEICRFRLNTTGVDYIFCACTFIMENIQPNCKWRRAASKGYTLSIISACL